MSFNKAETQLEKMNKKNKKMRNNRQEKKNEKMKTFQEILVLVITTCISLRINQ